MTLQIVEPEFDAELYRAEVRRNFLVGTPRDIHGRRLRFGGDPDNPKRSAVVRTHHEGHQFPSMLLEGKERAGTIRHIFDYDVSHSAVCDCSDGKVTPEECGGITILNAEGNPCASYRGHQYRAATTARNTLTIYSYSPAQSINKRRF